MARKHELLFVCTGNVCRSPMAEHLLRKKLGRNSNWSVASAGTAAAPGMRATHAAQRVLEDDGIDMTAHLSRPVTPGMIDRADVIVAMTAGHMDDILAMRPGAREKLFLLMSFSPRNGGDLPDPMGGVSTAYRNVRDEIEIALPGLINFINSLEFDE